MLLKPSTLNFSFHLNLICENLELWMLMNLSYSAKWQSHLFIHSASPWHSCEIRHITNTCCSTPLARMIYSLCTLNASSPWALYLVLHACHTSPTVQVHVYKKTLFLGCLKLVQCPWSSLCYISRYHLILWLCWKQFFKKGQYLSCTILGILRSIYLFCLFLCDR